LEKGEIQGRFTEENAGPNAVLMPGKKTARVIQRLLNVSDDFLKPNVQKGRNRSQSKREIFGHHPPKIKKSSGNEKVATSQPFHSRNYNNPLREGVAARPDRERLWRLQGRENEEPGR
jgi:hypothetical protein